MYKPDNTKALDYRTNNVPTSVQENNKISNPAGIESIVGADNKLMWRV